MIEGGLGNWFFYGHATHEDAKTGDILPRYLIDLDASREWIRENRGPERGPNKDRVGERCWFYAVNVRHMNLALGGKALIAQQRVSPQKDVDASARRCEACGHAYHLDGKKMEVSWAHGAEKWLCFSCYASWQDGSSVRALDTA